MADDGNRPPRDQRRNSSYMFSRFIGRVEKSTPPPPCPALFLKTGKNPPPPAGPALPVVCKMKNVVRHHPLDDRQERRGPPMARRSRLVKNRQRRDEEDEKKQKSRPREDNPENKFTRRDHAPDRPPVCRGRFGLQGRQGWRYGRNHGSNYSEIRGAPHYGWPGSDDQRNRHRHIPHASASSRGSGCQFRGRKALPRASGGVNFRGSFNREEP